MYNFTIARLWQHSAGELAMVQSLCVHVAREADEKYYMMGRAQDHDAERFNRVVSAFCIHYKSCEYTMCTLNMRTVSAL